MSYEKARRYATELLLKIGDAHPSRSIANIIEETDHEISLFTVPEAEARLEDVAGFVVPVDNNLYVNDDLEYADYAYVVAHELGHKLLHTGTSEVYFKQRSGNLHEPDRQQEEEANLFARCLLLPEVTFRKYFTSMSAQELAAYFMVPLAVVAERALELYSE